jgi:metallophosphoesterase (TIGR00282 family)
MNLQGRVFMRAIDCPFRTADSLLEQIDGNVIVVDMHAEATSEKIAMGWYLDGRVAAVVGSHTHVQTADERILPGGTAYITDAGMTGAFDSVIGIEKEAIINRFLTGIPNRFDQARRDVRLAGVVLSIDRRSRKSVGIERVLRRIETEEA